MYLPSVGEAWERRSASFLTLSSCAPAPDVSAMLRSVSNTCPIVMPVVRGLAVRATTSPRSPDAANMRSTRCCGSAKARAMARMTDFSAMPSSGAE